MENPAPTDASMASVQGSTGVDQDRGMWGEKRNDDRPEEDGTLNSGSPASTPLETIWLQRINDFQRNEGVAKEARDSDPLIVVRDGNADHTPTPRLRRAGTAKERAERQSGQSTHARERNTPITSVSRTLSALRDKAAREPEHRFRGLSRLLDKQMLKEAFSHLKSKAAPGIDGMVHAEYAKNLEERLNELASRLKAGRYRATCVKRHWIAKPGSSKMRPLGIPVLEDKIVQQAVKMILEPIWDADFCDESIGYRSGIGARQSSKDLADALRDGTYRWVVEADIRSFFDHIDHGWMVKMLEQRIADRPLIRLIVKWLKAGVLETDGKVVHPATGTPQGGVISPLLANIYLHFVQDQWIKKIVSKHSKGRVLFRRYADDSIVCFERQDDAQAYLRALPKRLGKFGLQIAEEKSSLVKFNRWEPDQSGRFTFLGFDFHWGRSQKYPDHVTVRRKTNRKKFRASLLALKEWLKKARNLRLPDLLAVLRRKLQGYWNYYGVRGNSNMLGKYQYEVYRLLFKWLNRRSQRRSMTKKSYSERWKTWGLPTARIVEETPKKPLTPTPRPA